MPFLILLGLWLVLELLLLILCFAKLGLWLTLGLMLLSSTVGALLIRQQRVNMAAMMQTPAEKYNARAGVYHFTAGMLLTIPGFLTSLIAIIFLIPPLRRVVGAGLLKIFRPQMVAEAFFNFEVGEAEFAREDFIRKADEQTKQEVTATREDGTIIQGELIDDEKKR